MATAPSAAPRVHGGRLEVIQVPSRALGRPRTVRVWLPPRFVRSHRYSVLYLNDGQNLFGERDADSGGGWHADEAAAGLIERRLIEPLIIVGIDNAGDRARGIDYLPVPDLSQGDPDPPGADRYLRFVIDELMPLINRRYPTLRGPAHTGFGGSSYGAVSAFYAAMSCPGVFGRLLLESPSVGIDHGVLIARARTIPTWPERMVIGVGTNERSGADTVAQLAGILRRAGLGDDRLDVVVQEGGRHDERSWASRFPNALTFLFRVSPAASGKARGRGARDTR